MADEEQFRLLKQGVDAWNRWRKDNRSIVINLQGASLREADLREADLREADLEGADLRGASLRGARLSYANLEWANLTNTKLRGATLVRTNLTRTNLTGASIFGISAWKVDLTDAVQDNLIISDENEPVITIDNLKIAQFIYLLLNNAEIRNVIDTISKKVVLILGRFTEDRKAVLDALREELRQREYLPTLFDFDKPTSRDLTETISTLAHLARFVIADITDAKSIPQELMAIVPNLPSVVVRPIILRSQREYAMFEHFRRFSWVLPLYEYDDTAHLLTTMTEQVIRPAEQKVREQVPPTRT